LNEKNRMYIQNVDTTQKRESRIPFRQLQNVSLSRSLGPQPQQLFNKPAIVSLAQYINPQTE
jgi:hypothetical protein